LLPMATYENGRTRAYEHERTSENMTFKPNKLERLENVLRWLQTAKQNLPDLNNGAVTADRIASASALVDRMQRAAIALRALEIAPATRHVQDGREERRAA
jgi:hypothetical protein